MTSSSSPIPRLTVGRNVLWFNKHLQECTKQVPFADGHAYQVVDDELRQLIISYSNELSKTEKDAQQQEMQNRYPCSQPISIRKEQLDQIRQGDDLHAEKVSGVMYSLLAFKLCTRVDLDKSKCLELLPQQQDNENEEQPHAGFIPLLNIKEQHNKNKKLSKISNVPSAPSVTTTAQVDDVGYFTPQYIVALMSRSFEIFILPHIGIPERLFPSLLHGELALHNPTRKHHYLIFELSVSNDCKWRKFRYQDRVGGYHEWARAVHHELIAPLTILPKPQFPFNMYDVVFERYRSGEYDCDGTTSKPNTAPLVEFGTDWKSYKIKDLHTFDVLFNVEGPILAMYAGGGKDKPMVFLQDQSLSETIEHGLYFNKSQEEQARGMLLKDWHSRIVECAWDDSRQLFYALFIRADKTYPNHIKTIQDTQTCARQNITPSTLLNIWKETHKASAKGLENDLPHKTTSVGYINKVLSDSNWLPSVITTSKLADELKTGVLSWELPPPGTTSASQDTKKEIKFEVAAIDISAVRDMKPFRKFKRATKVKNKVKKQPRSSNTLKNSLKVDHAEEHAANQALIVNSILSTNNNPNEDGISEEEEEDDAEGAEWDWGDSEEEEVEEEEEEQEEEEEEDVNEGVEDVEGEEEGEDDDEEGLGVQEEEEEEEEEENEEEEDDEEESEFEEEEEEEDEEESDEDEEDGIDEDEDNEGDTQDEDVEPRSQKRSAVSFSARSKNKRIRSQ